MPRASRFVLASIICLASIAYAAPAQAQSEPPPRLDTKGAHETVVSTDVSKDGAAVHVYLGSVDDSGWCEANFSGLPSVKFVLTEIRPVLEIKAMRGMKIHEAASPRSAVVGRPRTGATVHLLGIHQSYGKIWGVVDVHPAAHAALEKNMLDINRCGCSTGVVTVHQIDGLSIVECDRCESTWLLLDGRVVEIDFSPLGGPLVEVILPQSQPARMNC